MDWVWSLLESLCLSPLSLSAPLSSKKLKKYLKLYIRFNRNQGKMHLNQKEQGTPSPPDWDA